MTRRVTTTGRCLSIGRLSLAVLFTCSLVSIADGQNDLRSSFILEQAYGQLSSAANPTQFLAAAHSYEHLIAGGYVNGPILYNTGTAYLLAGQYTEALHYLTRCERHMGSTWEVLRNREMALKHGSIQAADLDWRSVVFFWHYATSYMTRLWTATLSFFFVWLILSLRLMGVRRLTVPCLVLGWILVIAFGSSVLTTLIQEADSDQPLEHRPIPEANP
jgi:hypothetical protein